MISNLDSYFSNSAFTISFSFILNFLGSREIARLNGNGKGRWRWRPVWFGFSNIDRSSPSNWRPVFEHINTSWLFSYYLPWLRLKALRVAKIATNLRRNEEVRRPTTRIGGKNETHIWLLGKKKLSRCQIQKLLHL